ncbi:MAG: hypothetical protein JWQ09_3585, partial [Segetibacter sp.]|nr:hypothetical protein [Segetibacter sp.]
MNVEHLKKYKDNCYSALSRDLTEFEKNFLLISGGILAFSITFIKDIIKVSEADCLIFLFVAWGLIIVSIGIMMHTFLKAANASDLLWKTADDFIEKHSLYDDVMSLSDTQCKEVKENINAILYPSKSYLRSLRKCAV